MILKKLGDLLELNLQLWDGTISQPKRVFVSLKDIDGALLQPEFEILHKSGGLYIEKTKTMLVNSVIFASFEVREADGITKSEIHSIGQDVYMRDISGEILASNLDVKVSSLNVIKSDLTGVVETNSVSGIVDKQEIIGTIEGNNSITGAVE